MAELKIGDVDYKYVRDIYSNSFTLDYDKTSKTVKMTIDEDTDCIAVYLGLSESTYHHSQRGKGLWTEIVDMKKDLEKHKKDQAGSTAPNGGDGDQVPPVTGDSSPQDVDAQKMKPYKK